MSKCHFLHSDKSTTTLILLIPNPPILILQVIISYPSGEQKKDVDDEIEDIVKYLSPGLYNTACKIVMVSPKLPQVVKGLVIRKWTVK